SVVYFVMFFFFQAEDGIRDWSVTGVQTCALPIYTERDELNRSAIRRLVVLRPIRVVLTNYPEGKTEELDAINNPEDPNAATRKRSEERRVGKECRYRWTPCD